MTDIPPQDGKDFTASMNLEDFFDYIIKHSENKAALRGNLSRLYSRGKREGYKKGGHAIGDLYRTVYNMR